ncbi:hypothetical protein D3C72_2559310 [compost metagenome]
MGFDGARRRNRILLVQGTEYIVGRKAERRQPVIGQVDIDALRLLTDDIDLFYPWNMQQLLA